MSQELNYNQLTSVTPIDGRYFQKTKELKSYFSEYAFIRYRLIVEIEYLIALSKIDLVETLDEEEIVFLKNIYQKFSISEAESVKEIESKIKHDVKSIEYYIKMKINENSKLEEKFLFLLISLSLHRMQNCTANILMIKGSIQKVILPKINEILKVIKEKILLWSRIPMLSRTHGQPASPSFLGKEFLVFYERLKLFKVEN